SSRACAPRPPTASSRVSTPPPTRGGGPPRAPGRRSRRGPPRREDAPGTPRARSAARGAPFTFGLPRVPGRPDGITACLFDLDGVLTQSAKVHAAAWKQMFDGFLRDTQGEGAEAFTDD